MRKSEFWKKYSYDQHQSFTQVLGEYKLKLSLKKIAVKKILS